MLAKTFDLSKEQLKKLIIQGSDFTFQKPKFVKRLNKKLEKEFKDLEKLENKTALKRTESSIWKWGEKMSFCSPVYFTFLLKK